MSFLSSWWSPQQNEDKKDVQSEQKAEESSPDATAKSSDWVTDLESKLVVRIPSLLICSYDSNISDMIYILLSYILLP